MGRRFPVRVCGAVLVYLAGAVAFVLIANGNAEDFTQASAILAIASLACGWLARSWPAAGLTIVLLPLAEPFGYPNESAYSEPGPVWVGALVVTPISAALILLGALAGVWVQRARARRHSRHTRAPQH